MFYSFFISFAGNETSKIYTTQLQLQLSKNDTLNEEIFLNAVSALKK